MAQSSTSVAGRLFDALHWRILALGRRLAGMACYRVKRIAKGTLLRYVVAATSPLRSCKGLAFPYR